MLTLQTGYRQIMANSVYKGRFRFHNMLTIYFIIPLLGNRNPNSAKYIYKKNNNTFFNIIYHEKKIYVYMKYSNMNSSEYCANGKIEKTCRTKYEPSPERNARRNILCEKLFADRKRTS